MYTTCEVLRAFDEVNQGTISGAIIENVVMLSVDQFAALLSTGQNPLPNITSD